MGIKRQVAFTFGELRAEPIVWIEITIGYEVEISFVNFKGAAEKKFGRLAFFVVNNESVAFLDVANVKFGL
jgi:hypothetical protein